ncbi:MAG: anaerobic ribonucleoside-triphosphate reductase activating protein [Bacteroidales bacterium]|nr:anaerobic ribonucleoside-triphosphate reductase activating protein [Bacteroidales bacterium]
MLKYANYDIVFQEIPDHITLAINLSNCPNRCEGCHSPYLWKDEGYVLDSAELDDILAKYKDNITCVCFMGGDAAPKEVAGLANYIKRTHQDLKVGWYSGKNEIPKDVNDTVFDYIKLGRYDAACGPLSSPTTNQRMVQRLSDGRIKDITDFFQKNRKPSLSLIYTNKGN